MELISHCILPPQPVGLSLTTPTTLSFITPVFTRGSTDRLAFVLFLFKDGDLLLPAEDREGDTVLVRGVLIVLIRVGSSAYSKVEAF